MTPLIGQLQRVTTHAQLGSVLCLGNKLAEATAVQCKLRLNENICLILECSDLSHKLHPPI